MAEVKVVRGTLNGVTVQVPEDTAASLGSSFEPEKAAKSSSKSSK